MTMGWPAAVRVCEKSPARSSSVGTDVVVESARLSRDKSVIFLFQQGGPSQFETFDPKPDAPEAVRTVTEQLEPAEGVQWVVDVDPVDLL